MFKIILTRFRMGCIILRVEKFVAKRIQELCKKKNMTMYRLAQKTELRQSTISNIMRRKTLPNLVTLEKICDGLGISLSQFFQEGDDIVSLTDEQKHVLDAWITLSEEDKKLIKTYAQGIMRK